MAEWLEQASQCHEMCCHDLEVMSLSPCRVELGVCGTSVCYYFCYFNQIYMYPVIDFYDLDSLFCCVHNNAVQKAAMHFHKEGDFLKIFLGKKRGFNIMQSPVEWREIFM